MLIFFTVTRAPGPAFSGLSGPIDAPFTPLSLLNADRWRG